MTTRAYARAPRPSVLSVTLTTQATLSSTHESRDQQEGATPHTSRRGYYSTHGTDTTRAGGGVKFAGRAGNDGAPAALKVLPAESRSSARHLRCVLDACAGDESDAAAPPAPLLLDVRPPHQVRLRPSRRAVLGVNPAVASPSDERLMGYAHAVRHRCAPRLPQRAVRLSLLAHGGGAGASARQGRVRGVSPWERLAAGRAGPGGGGVGGGEGYRRRVGGVGFPGGFYVAQVLKGLENEIARQ
jgi:hypothetical protein